MTAKYISRSLEKPLEKAMSQFPAVMLTGPRQSGKTTLLKTLFGHTFGYVSLDMPDIRESALSDPRSFLAMHPAPVIFDEAQNAADLFPYIKERIDSDRNAKGQYILTGSQNLMLSETVTESLAGRAATLRLLPLTLRELQGSPNRPLFWETRDPTSTCGKQSFGTLWDNLLRGFYPEIAVDPNRDNSLWQASYVNTYLERDVRRLRQVGDLSQFQTFLRVLAARSAQLVNLSDIARDIGVAVNTLKAWLSVLEATFQVIVLRPWYSNTGKRLVKTPKIYFTDTGTLCYLLGLKNPEHAAQGPAGGQIMETAVVSEIYKTLTHRGEEPRLYFWRTSSGTEVDIIVENGGTFFPVEVKLSATPRIQFGRSIRAFLKDHKNIVSPGYVVHPGETLLPLGKGVTALPFCDL